MGKEFAPRVSKRNRQKIDLISNIQSPWAKDLFERSDARLLEGAKLADVKLKDITVREQVRTYFDDRSLKELADNIKVNGLIQPLVLHREGRHFVLLCGERRFRALSLLKAVEAPCFILEDKSEEELMAIQFAENSSREELHYVDKANGILNYQLATKASERKIQKALGISKSEVHRSLVVAKMDEKIKKAAKQYNTEKYVLVEVHNVENSKSKKSLLKGILSGEITKRSHLKAAIRELALKEKAPSKIKQVKKAKELSVTSPQKRKVAKKKVAAKKKRGKKAPTLASYGQSLKKITGGKARVRRS